MENITKIIKSKKFLRIFIPALILFVILAVSIYYKLSDRGTAVEIVNVERGTVEQYFDTTGTLNSGASEKYYIYEGITVKAVHVKTGDSVSKGDVLATFDTSSMSPIISEKQKAYQAAVNNYNNAVLNRADTAKRVAEIDRQIAELNAQKKALEQASSSSTQTTRPQVTLPSQGTGDVSGLSQEQLEALRKQLANLFSGSQTPSVESIDAQIRILESEKAMTNAGQYDSVINAYRQNVDSAKEEYNKVLEEKKALDRGWTASADGRVADVYVKAGQKYVYVEDESSSSGFMSMLQGGMSSESLTPDLSSLLESMMSSSSSSAKKGVGIVVDYFNGYKVSFNLGKYDAKTIRVGMPALVTYTDLKYEGEVTYISPRADSGSNAITSMFGDSSGMASSGGSLEAEATITNPDENLILGFDAKLSILVSQAENVLAIPVESLVIEDGKNYVYIFDESTSTAVKREIEVGISSDTHYEVKNGLNEGDAVIVNASKVSDGMSVYVGE